MTLSTSDGKGYLLPSNPLEPDRVYVCVPVPDNEGHKRAFLAQIEALSYWYTWQRDSAKNGRLAASVWREIYDTVAAALLAAEGCGGDNVDLRTNPENPCQLQKSTDGGATWVTIYDTSTCIKGTIKTSAALGGAAFIQEGDVITQLQQIDNYYDGRQFYTYIGREGAEDEIKCLAALNAVNVFSKLHYEVTRKYGVVGGLTGAYVIAAAIMLVLGTPIGGFVFDTAVDLAYIGLAVMWPSNFTTTVQREFACILKNRAVVDSEGVVSFDYNLVVLDVQAKRTFYPSGWDALYGYLRLLKVDGLNIAGDTREITSTCCDFCSTTLNTAELYLTLANDYWGATAVKTATNNNTIVRNTNGLTINANGNTLYGAFQFMLNVPIGCEIVSVGMYVPTAGEPINSIALLANGTQIATWTNRRPFGAFTYAAATSQAGVIKLQWSAYNNNTTSGYFELQRIWVQYRGCNPFAAYV